MSTASHLTPVEELAAFLARSPSSQEISTFRLSRSALARVRALMEKNKAGTLTLAEDRELDRLVLLDDIIGLIQSHVAATDAHPDSEGRRGEDDSANGNA